jgi:hypothetical protein
VPPLDQGVGCRYCGGVPAAQVTFRGHQGIVLLMRFLSAPGPFCRDCGLATFRRMTERTLVQGWWGLASFFITPITVLINMVKRGRVARLAQPAYSSGTGTPMSPGRPLFARPMAIVGIVIPVVVVAIVAFAGSRDTSESEVGNCVKISGDTARVVSCRSEHDGRIIGTADTAEHCPFEATLWLQPEGSRKQVLCVQEEPTPD